MAESMVGLKRSHRCTEVSSADIGKKVTVMGWVAKRRNLGSLIFVDLRDRSGILQILFDENIIGKEGFDKAYTLRNEFVIAVEGEVIKRSGAVNENLKTGDIEIAAKTLRILSESETPPFPIEENIQTKEDIRLKYRCLDLRRPDIQSNIIMRSKVSTLTRAFLAQEGFFEITLYQAVFIQVSSMHFHSHHSSLNRCLCVLDMTDICRLQDVLEMRI